jgi:hypothetical protein
MIELGHQIYVNGNKLSNSKTIKFIGLQLVDKVV